MCSLYLCYDLIYLRFRANIHTTNERRTKQ
nr:MAG TPA: hypothetical protein [Caudoviricetes sp.]